MLSVHCLLQSRADGFFTFREVDRRRVALILHKSLQDLVDQSAPTNSLQFRMACRGREGETDYLPVTVYITDVNDNRPEFVNGPYNVTIDELTPPGNKHNYTVCLLVVNYLCEPNEREEA